MTDKLAYKIGGYFAVRALIFEYEEMPIDEVRRVAAGVLDWFGPEPEAGSSTSVIRDDQLRSDVKRVAVLELAILNVPLYEEVRRLYEDVLDDIQNETSGPVGTGYDPHDPRGAWQIPGAPGDRTIIPGVTGQTGKEKDDLNIGLDNGSDDGDDDHTRPSSGGPAGQDDHTSQTESNLTGDDDGLTGKEKDDLGIGAPTGGKTPTTTPASSGDLFTDDPGHIGPGPILLDLDGDGIEVSEVSQSTMFLDADDSGKAHRTAWAGKGDGVLFWDAENDGQITQKREYVFTEWDPSADSDFEALRARFDSNDDGKLTAADARFAQFKVMVTNADGTRVAKTLAQLGITEIDLRPDVTQVELADGSRITGQATFMLNRQRRTAADMVAMAEAQGCDVNEAVATVGPYRWTTCTGLAYNGDVASRNVVFDRADDTTRWRSL